MKKGFTLIEVVVVTGLLGIILLTVMGVFLNSMKATNKIKTEQRLDEVGKLVVERINRGIRPMASVDGYLTVCTGAPLSTLTLVDTEGETSTLTCIDSRITLGGENISSSQVTVDCATNFSISCDSADDSPVIQVNFTLISAEAGSYDEGVLIEKSFSIEVVMRGS